MKTIRNAINKDGSRTVTVRIARGEGAIIRADGAVVRTAANETVLPIKNGYHYRLGGQVEDIVAPHVMTEAVPCFWCSIEQKWIDV